METYLKRDMDLRDAVKDHNKEVDKVEALLEDIDEAVDYVVTRCAS